MSLGSAVGSVAGTESQEGSEYDETEEVKKGLNYFIGNQYYDYYEESCLLENIA